MDVPDFCSGLLNFHQNALLFADMFTEFCWICKKSQMTAGAQLILQECPDKFENVCQLWQKPSRAR